MNGAPAARQFDADGLLVQTGALGVGREGTTGRISSSTLGTVTTSQTYDGYGALATFSASASGVERYRYELTPDALGRIATKTETIGGVTRRLDYGYDDAGRLATVHTDGVLTSSYEYDANGNRLTRTAGGMVESGTYDQQDRLLSYGGAAYTWRPNGELESRTTSGATTRFWYDRLGNSRQAQLANGKQIDYVVDGRNRRVGKKVNGALVEGFLYEGQLRPVAWLDGSGAVKATFVYGTRVNVPEYMVTASGTFRFLTDHLGSPRLLVDANSGAIAQRLDYDEWGQVLQDTNPGFQPFGFAGGLYDRDVGLVRFGARDYDPSVGRWTNKDPIRFGGGWNLYVYATNNPVNFVDPSGLYTGVDDAVFTIGGALVGVLGQAASDMMSGNLSGWEDYAGAAIGGAVSGEALLYTGPVGAGALGGFAGNLAKQGLKNLNGKQCGFDAGSLAWDTGLGAATGFISGRGIPGITSGRNSYNAIFNQMVTKFENGTASSVTTETAVKVFLGRAAATGFYEGTFIAGGVNAGTSGLMQQ